MSSINRNTWELLGSFTTRNLKLKYQASFLGFLWSLITPLMQMMIYTVVFSVIIRVRVDWPFAVFLLTAQLPWIFFSNCLMMGAGSVIEHGNLIKKVKFPRALIPISTVLSNLINFGITLIVLVGFLVGYDIPLTAHLLLLIPATLILSLFTLGLTFITAALAVFFRDLFHILEVVLLLWFWAVPVVYP
ncbi:ABC transporter permease, partial [bacterium]|nr:ABC transporter permease [candidate division CSSED10-310 bacterium]